MDNYICKIATLEEMNEKWDYEIERADKDKENWIIWKQNAIDRVINKTAISYYGILNDKIICEATASFDSSVIQNAEGLVDKETAYLSAFRTIKEYQGQGYFSKLFKYMIEDLKRKGYKRVTLGVETTEIKNKQIYNKYGFNNYIKADKETYPDGHEIEVEYYSKQL